MISSVDEIGCMEFGLGFSFGGAGRPLPPAAAPVAPRKFSFGGAGRPGEYQAYQARRDSVASRAADAFSAQYAHLLDPRSGFKPVLQQYARSRSPREEPRQDDGSARVMTQAEAMETFGAESYGPTHMNPAQAGKVIAKMGDYEGRPSLMETLSSPPVVFAVVALGLFYFMGRERAR
jgi:hypothetical protein